MSETFTDGSYFLSIRAHTHRELIRECSDRNAKLCIYTAGTLETFECAFRRQGLTLWPLAVGVEIDLGCIEV